MEPTLRPGDWILVDPELGRVRRGHVVVAAHPDHEGEWIVKRVRLFDGDHVVLEPEDRRGLAYTVDMRAVSGRAWFRYWPPMRFGPIR